MVIESIKLYPKAGQPHFYEVGQRISYEPTGNEKDRISLMIQNISLEPTGQIALSLSGDKVILIGNTPYELYARPHTDEELEQIKKREEARKAQLPPAPPQQST